METKHDDDKVEKNFLQIFDADTGKNGHKYPSQVLCPQGLGKKKKVIRGFGLRRFRKCQGA